MLKSPGINFKLTLNSMKINFKFYESKLNVGQKITQPPLELMQVSDKYFTSQSVKKWVFVGFHLHLLDYSALTLNVFQAGFLYTLV